MSPRHSRAVALVLNPRTGLVSPQFHYKADTIFETVKGVVDPTWKAWKKLAGLLPPDRSAKQRVTFQPQTNSQRIQTQPQPPLAPVVQAPEGAHAREEVPPQLNEGEDDFPVLPANEGDVDISDDDDELGVGALPSEDVPIQEPSVRRSSRSWKPTRAALEQYEQDDLRLEGEDPDTLAFLSNLEVAKEAIDPFDATELDDPLAFMTKTDGDTMYYHQAMKQHDAAQFRLAMQKEVDDHIERGHFKIVPRSQVPKNVKPLPAVWSMKRKRRITTNEVYKWKSRLAVGGHKQVHGVNYWDTTSPVVTWLAIRLFLTLSLLFNWHSRQVDFVLAYPQAPQETDLYMEIPVGVDVKGKNKKSYVLKLLRNLYGQKQAGRVWNQFLHAGLIDMGFKQSRIDPCVYYRGKTIFLVYVDDGILINPDPSVIDNVIAELQTRFDITDEGDIADYVGVNVTHLPDGKLKLTQPSLIKSIIKDVNFALNTKPKDTPAQTTKILGPDTRGQDHSAEWNYRAVIGKLNYLEKSTRGEISYAVHQCARFSSNPKKSHSDAVHRIVRYLVGTQNEGVLLDPKEPMFEVWCDADFCGLWDKQTAAHDPATARSRSGYLITFAKCPILWRSALQTEHALSTTEAELISLSTALRDAIPMMNLLREMKSEGILSEDYLPKVYCKAMEDNSGCTEICRVWKMRPRTKHINVKYWHFRSYAEGPNKSIEIVQIPTTDQIGDLWTKPLGPEPFKKFVKLAFGWCVDTAIKKYYDARECENNHS